MIRTAPTVTVVVAVSALTVTALSAAQGVPSFVPGRLLADVETYYDLGIHRTGYPGDLETSAWLADRFGAAGLATSEHAFWIKQFVLDEASIQDARGRIEAFPVWLPRATPATGVTGHLVAISETTSVAEVRGAIAWLPTGGGAAERARLHEKAIAAGAAAILIETSDGLGLGVMEAINAERAYVATERPVPTVIYGARDSERLRQSVGFPVTVRMTGRVLERAEAKNVYATKIVDEDADWIVISTPSSGWFECAGERGPGVAMLLALAEWIGQRSGSLNYMFVATSGHELDYLGARLFHEAQLAPPPERTRAWLHLGANIATPPWGEIDGVYAPMDEVTTGTLQATSGLVPVLQEAFEDLEAFSLRTGTRIGEFRDLVEHGYNGIGVVGGSNPWFHVPGDDPRAVSPETLAEVTQATARALLGVERLAP